MFPLSEMPSLYAAGDLFLFTSYQENCPLSPLEAAASGMPVIYRNINEYKLLYKNEYLKANNNAQYVAHVKRLMDNKEEYKKGLEISEKLIPQFEKDEIRKKLIELYDSLNDFATMFPNVKYYAS